MAYRNGTYVAFHANGTSEPTESDLKYYGLLKAWKVRADGDFEFIDSHEKSSAVRDSSKRSTLEQRLRLRLRSSKNMLLVIGKTTREDTDWVPLEICYAVDDCQIPIIAAYTGYETIINPVATRDLWPAALLERIDNKSARVIHIAFRQQPITAAIQQYDFNTFPKGPLTYYTPESYRVWGLGTN
mgnify:CR=1 FL=1